MPMVMGLCEWAKALGGSNDPYDFLITLICLESGKIYRTHS